MRKDTNLIGSIWRKNVSNKEQFVITDVANHYTETEAPLAIIFRPIGFRSFSQTRTFFLDTERFLQEFSLVEYPTDEEKEDGCRIFGNRGRIYLSSETPTALECARHLAKQELKYFNDATGQTAMSRERSEQPEAIIETTAVIRQRLSEYHESLKEDRFNKVVENALSKVPPVF